MSGTLLSIVSWAAIGVATGLGSGVLTAMVYKCEDAFQRLPVHWMWWPMLGGLVVGVGGLIEPSALGVGYDNIRLLLAGTMAPHDAALLLLIKALIWAIALASVTSGGVLAPLLIFGGAIGALATAVLPSADPGFWALLGMSAIMAGTMRTPLTAALFAVELTGNLSALLPFLVACGMAYATTVLLLKRSILTEKIARRGPHITREYHADPFEQTWVKDVMVRNVESVPARMSISEAIEYFMGLEHRHKSYPVMHVDGMVSHMLSRGDILSWLNDTSVDRSLSICEGLPDEPLVYGRPKELVSDLA